MKITGFIWLENIVEKLAQKHDVQPQKVREVFANHPHVRFVEKGHRSGENVYVTLGQTDSGRYLTIFFVHKKDRHTLILSGRDMTYAERRKYERR